jgi:hypothetical protein
MPRTTTEGTLREHSENIRGTFRENSSNIQGTLSIRGHIHSTGRTRGGRPKGRQKVVMEHAGNMQGTCREHAGNMQGTCRAHAGNMQGTCREHAGNMQGTCREHAGNMHATLSSAARTFPASAVFFIQSQSSAVACSESAAPSAT